MKLLKLSLQKNVLPVFMDEKKKISWLKKKEKTWTQLILADIFIDEKKQKKKMDN